MYSYSHFLNLFKNWRLKLKYVKIRVMKETKTIVVKIEETYITLGQLLKKCDLVSTGGEAKFFLNSHVIEVNGESENRRGRKCYSGDSILIDGQEYLIG